MLNWLRNRFKKNTSGNSPVTNARNSTINQSTVRNDGFQPAIFSDSEFIFEAILSGASDGHFTEGYLAKIAHKGLRHQIKSSILHRECITHRGQCKSDMYVFLENNCPVGFSWVVETDKNGEKELYALAVSPAQRKRGIGRSIAKQTIQAFPQKTKFLARLYQPSQVMLRLLISMGFKRSVKQGKTTVWLIYVS